MFLTPLQKQRQFKEDTETTIRNLMISKKITLEEARKIIENKQKSIKDF